ncbi:MAG: proton-conducting transporter membrane subunit, partial [Pirellulales bacterium]
MEAVLTGILVWILGGLAALILSRFPRLASTVGASAAVVGALIALTPTLRVLLDGGRESQVLPWDAVHGRFHLELDPLGAAFLLPILGLSVISAVYGAKYLMAYRHKKSLGAPWFFFNTFIAGMTLVVIARTVLLFVVAWEVMSLTAFFLITFEHEDAGVRRAGWVYLVAAQLGVAFLLAAFMILGNHARSLEFAAFTSATTLSATTAGAVFVLTLIGFGAKAGVVPFHVWLPEAHPAAPSHVSALMSGVMIKMGLYGLLRVLTFLGQPAPWWGITLAVTGMITALVGISVALYQRDIKRIVAVDGGADGPAGGLVPGNGPNAVLRVGLCRPGATAAPGKSSRADRQRISADPGIAVIRGNLQRLVVGCHRNNVRVAGCARTRVKQR